MSFTLIGYGDPVGRLETVGMLDPEPEERYGRRTIYGHRVSGGWYVRWDELDRWFDADGQLRWPEGSR